MPLALTVSKTKHDGKQLHVYGTVVPSGSYPAGGDTLSFAKGEVKSSKVPHHVTLVGEAGFVFTYIPGASRDVGKVKIFGQEPTSATAGVIGLSQLAAAAYPAALTGDTIRVHAVFEPLV